MSSGKMSSKSVLSLYRQIIRSAKVFPSRNRARILEGIRSDFRINKNIAEGEKRTELLNIAIKGIQQLNMYSKLDPTRGADWAVTLDSSPMPDNNNIWSVIENLEVKIRKSLFEIPRFCIQRKDSSFVKIVAIILESERGCVGKFLDLVTFGMNS